MITLEEATTAHEFHYTGPNYIGYRLVTQSKCSVIIGARGGITITTKTARRSGATKLWKTRPSEFSLPVKIGFKGHAHIDHTNVHYWHTPAMCPLTLAPIHLGLDDSAARYDDRRADYWRAVVEHIAVCADCREGA